MRVRVSNTNISFYVSEKNKINMKVLHIMPMLGVGGASRVISDVLPRIDRAGIEVALLINKPSRVTPNVRIMDADLPGSRTSRYQRCSCSL